MTKPAVTRGTYVDLRFMPGLKVARVSIDIPIEQSNEFLSMFGAPDRSNPVWVAVARLQENGPDAVVTPVLTPSAAVEGQDRPSKFTRSNLAGVKCKEPAFQDWLFDNTGSDLTMSQFLTRDDLADAMLKEHLGIRSKRELDTLPHKAEAFDRMITTFKNRDLIR